MFSHVATEWLWAYAAALLLLQVLLLLLLLLRGCCSSSCCSSRRASEATRRLELHSGLRLPHKLNTSRNEALTRYSTLVACALVATLVATTAASTKR